MMARRLSDQLVAAFALASLLAACGGAPDAETPSPTPSGPLPTGTTAEPGTSDSIAQPSAGAGPGAQVPDGEVVQVVADELSLRAQAGTAADLVGTLERGAAVRIESGPASADGFSWYEVVDIAGRRGWVAQGDATDLWLAPITHAADGMPILTLTTACDVVGPIRPPVTTLFADGRVIADGEGGLRVRQLSDAGMADFRADVLGSPYLQASATHEPEPRPDASDPPGHGACLYSFTVAAGSEAIVVNSVSWFGDAEESQFYEPAPERKALDGIARNLAAIHRVLGDESWTGPAVPYLAADYSLWLGSGPQTPEGGVSIDAGTLPVGDLTEFGEPAGSGRCGVVTREQAFEIARVLNDAGSSGEAIQLGEIRLETTTIAGFEADGVAYTFALVGRTPAGRPGCDEIAL